jgi:dihydrofolate reductase
LRAVTASFFMSLDGVVDSPQDWHFPYMNDEMREAVDAGMSADTIVLGRRTYEEWAAYWPHQPSDGGLADHINGTPKLVASRSLERLEWQNARLIDGDVADALTELKRQSGGEISITGSGTLVRTLLEADVIDELRLLIHPIVVGSGKHLFEGGTEPKGMELAESAVFATGVLNVTYRRAAGSGADGEGGVEG